MQGNPGVFEWVGHSAGEAGIAPRSEQIYMGGGGNHAGPAVGNNARRTYVHTQQFLPTALSGVQTDRHIPTVIAISPRLGMPSATAGSKKCYLHD